MAVMGRSGSGKTTLLNILGLLDRPTSGRYVLDGGDVTDAPEAERARLRARVLGFVFQSFHLVPARSATDNVSMALMYAGVARRDRKRMACGALEAVGLGHRTQAFPTTMSGGEQQRVAIARAIATKPQVLLCDEPTGDLDTATAAGVLRVLDDLHHDGMTIVMITHDADVALRADRTCRIIDGTLEQ